jgi:hypothetical protein
VLFRSGSAVRKNCGNKINNHVLQSKSKLIKLVPKPFVAEVQVVQTAQNRQRKQRKLAASAKVNQHNPKPG